jgi:hypothetical protein
LELLGEGSLELLGEGSLELRGISWFLGFLVAWLLGKGAGTKNHTELRFAALAAGIFLVLG